MFKLTFLNAAMALTKMITRLRDGSIIKDTYPDAKAMTSTTVTVSNIKTFYDAILANGTKGACLLKGNVSEPLVKASRKNKMPKGTNTMWVCFDLDGAPFSTPDEFMKAVKLDNVSYVLQYSASSKIDPKVKTMNAHIFALLNEPMAPQQLKCWLMHLNLSIPAIETRITLTDDKNHIHWPLDITTCQNDKLLYTSPPKLVNLSDPHAKDRYQLIVKSQPHIDVTKSVALKPLDALQKQQRTKLNALREQLGLTPNKTKPTIVGEYTVQKGCTAVSKYEVFDDGEYWRFNLEDGQSKAYWCYKKDIEFLHSWKSDDVMLTKEVLPDWYKEQKATVRADLQAPTDTRTGKTLLAFREKRTAEYWKGTYSADTNELDMHRVKNETMLDHFLQAHGSGLGPFVPEYQIIFDPHNPVVYDADNKTINTFQPTKLMTTNAPGSYPIIQRVLDSAVGTGEVQERFLNWLAVIVQQRIKTKIGWVLHGTYGTGKGVIINDIMKPILGKYAHQILAPALSENFCGWREQKLLIFLDEIEVDLFEKKDVEAKMRNWVTEPEQDIRRMGTDWYKNPCYNNWIAGSNKPQPVHIPKKDRRWNVGQYQNERFITTRKEIEKDLPKELPAFAHYLMTRAADADLAGEIYDSEDRRQIQELNITSVDEVAAYILEGNIQGLWQNMPDESLPLTMDASTYASILKDWIKEAVSYVTRDQLAAVFKYCIGTVPEGANKFTSFLRHHGIRTKKIRINNQPQMGITVTWNISSNERRTLLHSVKTPDKIRRIK